MCGAAYRLFDPPEIDSLNGAMKINDIYNKHARRLANAARAGRPFAALTYNPDGTQSRFRTFAGKDAASAFLRAAKPHGLGGMVVESDSKGLKAIYVPPVTGFGSFDS
jgi:hypothetical protein